METIPPQIMSEAVTDWFQGALESTYEFLELVGGCARTLLLYTGIAFGACVVALMIVSVLAVTALLFGTLGYEGFQCFLELKRRWGERRRAVRGGGEGSEERGDEDLEMGGSEKAWDVEEMEVERKETEAEGFDDDSVIGVSQEQKTHLLGKDKGQGWSRTKKDALGRT